MGSEVTGGRVMLSGAGRLGRGRLREVGVGPWEGVLEEEAEVGFILEVCG